MPDTNAIPLLVEVLGRWHEFYMLLGTASGTLVGLLFVAATVASGVFTSARRSALSVFLSASVIHFSTILVICLIVLVPGQSWTSLGVMIASCGIFGIGYYCFTWRNMVREGMTRLVDLEDRVWYGVLPVIGYLFETASGVTLALRLNVGCEALALSMGVVLVVGIHNAWDITVWTITRPQDGDGSSESVRSFV